MDECACECPCGVEIKGPDDCTCAVVEEESEESCICAELGSEDEEEERIKTPDGCTCGYVEPDSSGTASDPCLCGVKNCGCQVGEVCVKECFYGPMEAWWTEEDFKKKKEEEEAQMRLDAEEEKSEEDSKESISPFGGTSKRYVILKRMPTRRKSQMEFLDVRRTLDFNSSILRKSFSFSVF